jgi:hypothetical protein
VFFNLKEIGLLQKAKNFKNEDMGKRLNIEVKKFIKANKEKQLSFNLLNLEIIKPKSNPL